MTGGTVWWWLLAALSIGQATEDISFSVNTKTYSHVVSDRFLSITIDPILLMDAEYSTGITKVINLARGLAPAYVRLGSPASNRYQFLKAGTHRQPNASYAITEAQWMILNDFAQKSGLEPIVCVNIMSRQGGKWDTRNLRDLVAYSDRRKYKLSWQFGYELQQHRHRWSGTELGNDLKTLRGILDAYPRYRQSKILAPDVTSTKDPADVRFLQDFLNTAGSALSAVTWHAFEGDNATRSDQETNALEIGENDLADKLGKEFTSKPLWIAESYRDPGEPSRFEDGLSWAVKLGEAAKIGVQTVLKRPQINNLQTPTPDYWVSFLHKTLVGEIVLANDWVPPSTGVNMFSHCSNNRRQTTNVFVNNQLRYEPGSVTFFGVNQLTTPVDITLKLGSLTKRGDVELHEYVLTRDESDQTRSQVPKVLLNGRRLSLDFTGRLPILTPKVLRYANKMAVSLPAGSTGFWVVSGARARACLPQDGGELRVRRSADTELAGEGVTDIADVENRHNETHSQIVMEIGNLEEYGANTTHKNDHSVLKQSSPDGTVAEELDRELQENNATQETNGEDNERPKYHISKVLVVFESESGGPRDEDRRALLLDGETAVSEDREISRVSRALERDAFAAQDSALSLLLREPLLSLKRLRERRWEQLQRKKLLAGRKYEQALGIQASVLFPKRFVPGQSKRSQPTEGGRGDYDYVTEEDEPVEDAYNTHQWTRQAGSKNEQRNTQQYPSQPDWTRLTSHNAKNVGKPEGNALNKRQQLWEMERGAMDGSHFKERPRHIRENGDGIHMCVKESGQKESPEESFGYGARNERVPEVLFEDRDVIGYETRPRASQCLGGADTLKKRTKLYDGGASIDPADGYYPLVADYAREGAALLRTAHVKPSYRNRRHLVGSVETVQSQVMTPNRDPAKREVTTAAFAINDVMGKGREIKDVFAVTLTANVDQPKEHEVKDVSTVTLTANEEREVKDVSSATLAANEEVKQREVKDVSAVNLAANEEGAKEHEVKDVSAATLAANEDEAKERTVKDVSSVTLAANEEAKEREEKDVSAVTLAANEDEANERDRKDAEAAESLMSEQAGAEAITTVDSEERNDRDTNTDIHVGSLQDNDQHLESAGETDTADKDIIKFQMPTLFPILKNRPLMKPLQIPKLPLPNLFQSRHLDEENDATLQHHKSAFHAHHAKIAHLINGIKSRTHKRIEELKKKTQIPKAKAHAAGAKAKTAHSKGQSKLHSLVHIKETLKAEENNLREKVEAMRDEALSLRNADPLDHIQAGDETRASSTEKRNSVENAQQLLKERIKQLLDTVTTRLDKEPSVFERSAELRATLQNLKPALVKQAPTEPEHNVEAVLASQQPAEQLGEGVEGTEAPPARRRRQASYKSAYPDQHSKKRFLKTKELQALDSPKGPKSTNHRNAIRMYEGSALRCITQESSANTDGQPSKCAATQPNNLPLKTAAWDLSKTSGDANESQLDYKTKANQVGQSGINTVASSGKQMSDSVYGRKQDGHGGKSWHSKNTNSNSWGSGGSMSGNINSGFISSNLHLIRPIPRNENQVDVNKRSKRYVELSSGEIDSDEFFNQRLSTVDSNTNQDVSKNELKRQLPLVERMPRFKNLQKLKRTKRVRGDDINREFKDWNLALSSQGLQIESETFRNDVDRDDMKHVGDVNHASPTASGVKAFPSNEPKKTQKRHYTGNDVASQKLGFFGNILKKIYSLFYSLFDKPLK